MFTLEKNFRVNLWPKKKKRVEYGLENYEGKFVSWPLYELKAQECFSQKYKGLKTWNTKEQRWAGNILYPKILCQPFLPSKQRRERVTARMVQNENKAAGAFFFATLVLWLLSLSFEIVFNKRNELLCVIAGCCFFQTANWVIRFRFSKDPLFVNTSVSLLHSFIISSSGSFPISSFWVFFLIFHLGILLLCGCF